MTAWIKDTMALVSVVTFCASATVWLDMLSRIA
jgi:hypothetical protein